METHPAADNQGKQGKYSIDLNIIHIYLLRGVYDLFLDTASVSFARVFCPLETAVSLQSVLHD